MGAGPDQQAAAARARHPAYALDAFGADGRFLGTIDLPAGTRVDIAPYIRDGLLVAVAVDEAGTIMVKRYRLVLPEEE